MTTTRSAIFNALFSYNTKSPVFRGTPLQPIRYANSLKTCYETKQAPILTFQLSQLFFVGV